MLRFLFPKLDRLSLKIAKAFIEADLIGVTYCYKRRPSTTITGQASERALF
jgi:hypothetical protein